jgi:hypothetical protein
MKRKRQFLMMLCFCWAGLSGMVQPVWDGTATTNWTGAGTEASPYLITTAEQLAGIAEAVKNGNDFKGKFIKLANNICLNDPDAASKRNWLSIGGKGYTVAPGEEFDLIDGEAFFRGTFDVGGYMVSGYSYNYRTAPPQTYDEWNFTGWYQGFFGYIEDATIKNLHLLFLMRCEN